MDEIGVPMTRERALALHSVLYGKFSDPSFVAQVNALAARNVPGSLMIRKAPQELAFSVQADAKTLAINHLLSRSGTLHLPRHPEPPVLDKGAL